MNKAVFIDRDGTIIEDVGYIRNPFEIIFFPECFKALRMLQGTFLLFIVTNQSGISRGLTTEKEVMEVNDYLIEVLRRNNITIQELYYCPHKTEDNCICKKPSPYFVNKAAVDYDLDLKSSYIIGDHPSDILCGLNAGIKPVYLLTGHGKKHRDEISDDIMICYNILEAAENILDELKQKRNDEGFYTIT